MGRIVGCCSGPAPHAFLKKIFATCCGKSADFLYIFQKKLSSPPSNVSDLCKVSAPLDLTFNPNPLCLSCLLHPLLPRAAPCRQPWTPLAESLATVPGLLRCPLATTAAASHHGRLYRGPPPTHVCSVAAPHEHAVMATTAELRQPPPHLCAAACRHDRRRCLVAIAPDRRRLPMTVVWSNWQGDPRCRFCPEHENIDHLFFGCATAKYVWSMAAMIVGVPPCREEILHGWLIAAICWGLWVCRLIFALTKK